MAFKRTGKTTSTLVVVAALVAPFAWPSMATAATVAALPSDFDGDGYVDLAIGVPFEDDGAGAVNVLHGSAVGLTAEGDHYWTQDSPGVKGASAGRNLHGDLFGQAVASGDFDRDGFADLAIGVPGDKVVAGIRHGGAVNVLYGSKQGLTADEDELWSQVRLPGQPEGADRFGWALASGDLDGDGYWDLAIGVPGDIVGGHKLGSVIVLYGGAAGLVSTNVFTTLTRSVAGVSAVCNGWFGASLAMGDLDHDGFDDLAVGATGRFGCDAGGDVAVFYGGPDRPLSIDSQLWSQDSPGIDVGSQDSGRFGYDLAIGDFDADGSGDLAVSSDHFQYGDPCPVDFCNGGITVLYGGDEGLTADGSQFWYPGTPGIPIENVGESTWIGSILGAGDVSGDNVDDLVVGDGFEVMVLPGTTGGLTTTGASRWGQDSPGVPGTTESEDSFGSSLAISDFGHSSHADLAIGVPRENYAGAVTVLYGGSAGLSGVGAQGWSQDSSGVKGSAEREDGFGTSLAR